MHYLIKVRGFSDELQFRSELCANWSQRGTCRKFVVKAMESDDDRSLQNDAIVIGKLEKDNAEKPQLQNAVAKLQESIGSHPVFVFSVTSACFRFNFDLLLLKLSKSWYWDYAS